MKTFLFIFLCSSTTLLFGQIDGLNHANFNRNSIKVGLGNHFGNSGLSEFTNFQFEYERKIGNLFSSSLSTNLIKQRSSSINNNHIQQFNANFFVYPFGNLKRHEFKIGAGINNTYYVNRSYSSYLNFDGNSHISNRMKTISLDFGLNGLLEYNFNVTKKFSLGLNFYGQYMSSNKWLSGSMIKAGYSF